MGSYAHLGLGRLEVDWGKNFGYPRHSALFRPNDLGEADYPYADGAVERKPAYVRPLGAMLKRLELLGYGPRHLRRRFEEELEHYPSYYDPLGFTYDDLAQGLRSVDVRAVQEPEEGDYDLGEFLREVVLHDPEFQRAAPQLAALEGDSLHHLENLDARLVLGLLAANPANHTLDVEWRIQDVSDGGWVSQGDVYEPLGTFERYLVVTEGSSDSGVLEAALSAVAPDVEDFFDFVDMSERYPFTGTGNVVRFAEGLVRIGVERRIVFLLDNDTVGVAARDRIASLPLPSNMVVTVLPDLDVCRAVRTAGPTGETVEDVNGRASSIEFFLDMSHPGLPQPRVRWTTYVEQSGEYQGQLESKEAYVRHFFDAAKRRFRSYDLTKLEMLWGHMIDVSAELA